MSGNVRANGERKPAIPEHLRFLKNDFAALRPDAPVEKSDHRF